MNTKPNEAHYTKIEVGGEMLKNIEDAVRLVMEAAGIAIPDDDKDCKTAISGTGFIVGCLFARRLSAMKKPLLHRKEFVEKFSEGFTEATKQAVTEDMGNGKDAMVSALSDLFDALAQTLNRHNKPKES